jgi:hypothetical protein
MSTIDDDPVAFLDDLMDSRKQKRETAPIFPGTTPPRNEAKTVQEYDNAWVVNLPHKEYYVGGNITRMYPIGSLAKALGKQPVTIRSWEDKGWLPPATFRTPPPNGHQIPGKPSVGRRLYSQEQLLLILETYQRYIAEGRNDWSNFASHINQHFHTH